MNIELVAVVQEVISFTIEDHPRLYYNVNDFSFATKIRPELQIKIHDLTEFLKTFCPMLEAPYASGFENSTKFRLTKIFVY